MNKRLEELRDKGAQEHLRVCHAYLTDMEPSKVSPKFSYAAGFDAAIAELMPRVERLTACIQELHDQCGYASPWQIRMSKELTEWREFMGEG